MYVEGMKKALDNREKIKDCLNRHRDDAHKIPADEAYWPVSVFCSACNRDTTTVTGWDGEWGLSYTCECGHGETADIRTAKGVKLGWRWTGPCAGSLKDRIRTGGKGSPFPGRFL